MNTRRPTLIVGFTMTLLLLGTACSKYTKAPERFSSRQARLELSPPQGWLRYNPDKPHLTITRDGLELERISVVVRKCGEELPGTERVYRPSMLPVELADLSMSLKEERDETKNFQIDNIELIDVDGIDAYRGEARFVTPTGLRKRLLVVGFLSGDYFVELQYLAAEEVYFDKYASAFERLVSSVRLSGQS